MEKKTRNKLIINIVITVGVLALAVFYLTKSQIVTHSSLKEIKPHYYFVVLGFFFTWFILVSTVDFLVYRTIFDEMPLSRCYATQLAGNLGSNITPFKVGHFPFMVYYKCNAGISASESILGLVKCQVVYSLSTFALYFTLTIVLACLGTTINFQGSTVYLFLVALVGLGFHTGVLTALFLLSFNKKLQNFFLNIWTKFVFKFKKTGNREDYVNEKRQKFDIYREQITIIFSNFAKYIPAFLLYLLFMLCSGSMQYISYLLITGNTFSFGDFFTFYTLNLAMSYITNIIPIPGGVGASEVLFSLVFASAINGGVIGSCLVLWRVGTYYGAIIVEALVVITALFVKRKRNKILR